MTALDGPAAHGRWPVRAPVPPEAPTVSFARHTRETLTSAATVAGRLYVLGERGTWLSFDGRAWRRSSAPCVSGGNALMTGAPGGRLVVTSRRSRLWPARPPWEMDGDLVEVCTIREGQWSDAVIAATGEPAAVHALADGEVWLGLDRGAARYLRGDGRRFRPVPDPPGETRHGPVQPPRAVWAAAANDVWMVDWDGTMLHFDGEQARPWRNPLGGDPRREGALALSGSGPSDVWAVGEAGQILHFDGAAWRAVESPVRTTLRAVWAAGPGEAWAVGDDGTVLRGRAGRWVRLASGTRGGLHAIAGFGGDVFVVGEAGTVLRIPGGAGARR